MAACRRSRSAASRSASAACSDHGQGERLREAHRSRDILCPRPQAALLPASEQERSEFHPAAAVEQPHPARASDLVGGHGGQVEPRPAKVHRHLAHRLHRVGVHHHTRQCAPGLAARSRPAARCRPRCSPTSPRARTRPTPSASASASSSSSPVPIDLDLHALPAARGHLVACLPHGGVLDRGRDRARALSRRHRDRGPSQHGHVVGFGAAAHEGDLRRLGPDRARTLRPRLIQGRARLPSPPVRARRVAERRRQGADAWRPAPPAAGALWRRGRNRGRDGPSESGVRLLMAGQGRDA